MPGPLPPPARYCPWHTGRYEVAAGLRPLGVDLGHGARDGQVFHLDRDWPRYRAGKLAARRARFDEHVGTHRLPSPLAAAVAGWIAGRLATEHPDWFRLRTVGGVRVVEAALTGETLHFGPEWELLDAGPEQPDPPYRDALDALACQVQADLAVTCRDGERDWLAHLHVCSPSGWAPREKLGLPFRAVHAPVPGFEKLAASAGSLVGRMVETGPRVRFVWGFSGTDRPNRHPIPPPGVPAGEWLPPVFDPGREPPFWVHVERQVTVPFAEENGSLFLIHPVLVPAGEVRADPALAGPLAAAIRGMSPESRAYKGIGPFAEAMAEWLERHPKKPQQRPP